MVRVEMGTVKVQPRKAGGFMITLPSAVAKFLKIRNSETLKVLIDVEAKEIIYKLQPE
jgi:hypothetical protein